MEVQIESPPKIERDSWVGKIIQFSGAKTWCSLVVRGIVALKLLALYGLGWHLLSLIGDNVLTSHGFFIFLASLALITATVVVSMLAVGGTIYLIIRGAMKFNCWAQNRCTPIFKDE